MGVMVKIAFKFAVCNGLLLSLPRDLTHQLLSLYAPLTHQSFSSQPVPRSRHLFARPWVPLLQQTRHLHPHRSAPGVR